MICNYVCSLNESGQEKKSKLDSLFLEGAGSNKKIIKRFYRHHGILILIGHVYYKTYHGVASRESKKVNVTVAKSCIVYVPLQNLLTTAVSLRSLLCCKYLRLFTSNLLY